MASHGQVLWFTYRLAPRGYYGYYYIFTVAFNFFFSMSSAVQSQSLLPGPRASVLFCMALVQADKVIKPIRRNGYCFSQQSVQYIYVYIYRGLSFIPSSLFCWGGGEWMEPVSQSNFNEQHRIRGGGHLSDCMWLLSWRDNFIPMSYFPIARTVEGERVRCQSRRMVMMI